MQNDSMLVPPAVGYDNVRRHPRLMFSVPLKIHHLTPQGVRTMRGISLDISKGGLGALVHTRLMLDETIEIDMRLVGSPSLAVAVVRHSSMVVSGFEFIGLNSDELTHIDRLNEIQRTGFLGTMKSAAFLEFERERNSSPPPVLPIVKTWRSNSIHGIGDGPASVSPSPFFRPCQRTPQAVLLSRKA
jgi:hypothetical protein